ncbi:MAG TPA: flagellar hook-associated protein FlgK [Clostridiales bacterium]|nr:flagellar hook-associated protein FlgK [Clostridiales bacterium]
MSGIFSTFNTAKRGMFAQQQAINTTGHNIANANTEGFSRQRVQLVTTPGYSLPNVGMVGTGVDIADVTRIRDAYLDVQIRLEKGIAGQYQARLEILEQVEMVFMEPSDTGLNTTMGLMWDAWQELAKSPENSNARTIVKENSKIFTENLNHLYQQLDSLKNDSISLTEKKAMEIHSILDQIKSLNDQIFKITIKNEKPNDLMDQRDLLMDKLSAIIDFTSVEDKYGRVTIKSGGKTLLQTEKGNEMPFQLSVVRSVKTLEDGNIQVTLVRGGDSINGITTLTMTKAEYDSYAVDADSGSFLQEGAVIFNDVSWDGINHADGNLAIFDVKHGELRGYQDISAEVAKYQDQLNGLARAIAYAVNTIHTGDGNPDDPNPVSFFVGEGNSGDISKINAGNIKVNEEILKDVRLINTRKSEDSPEGNGERALAIAQLRNARLPIQDFIENPNTTVTYKEDEMKFENVSGGNTFEGYFKDIIAELGISAQQAVRMVENQEALTGQLLQRRYSISGVSIDEEVANLIQFQHAYQANANVISTLTAMLDTIINRMGV